MIFSPVFCAEIIYCLWVKFDGFINRQLMTFNHKSRFCTTKSRNKVKVKLNWCCCCWKQTIKKLMIEYTLLCTWLTLHIKFISNFTYFPFLLFHQHIFTNYCNEFWLSFFLLCILIIFYFVQIFSYFFYQNIAFMTNRKKSKRSKLKVLLI